MSSGSELANTAASELCLAATPSSRGSGCGLPAFIAAAERHATETLDTAGLPQEMGQLMRTGGRTHQKRCPLRHPLAPFYFVLGASGGLAEPAAIRMGAAFILLLRAQRMLDDVQDEQLQGQLLVAGDAVATHCGSTLLFLGIDSLWQVAGQLGPVRGELLRRAMRENLMTSGRGQYQDLVGRGREEAAVGALSNGVEKSAVFALPFLLAGLCTLGEDDTMIPQPFGDVGDAVAAIGQATNDLDDLFFGEADDLRVGARNAVISAFLESCPAEGRPARLQALRDADTMEMRRMLNMSGAVADVASWVESARRRVHTGLAHEEFGGPFVGLALAWVDAWVGRYFCTPPLLDALDVDTARPEGLSPDDTALLIRLQAERTRVSGA